MNKSEYEAKLKELKEDGKRLLDAGKLDEAKAKSKEMDELTEAFEADKAKAAEALVDSTPEVPEELKDETNSLPLGQEVIMQNEMNMGADSKVYLTAWLKKVSGREDKMTEEENAAYTHTTVNTPAVLPTTMVNNIWSLVEEQHSILGDITTYRTGTILEVAVHKSIKAGKAAKVAEGTAATDENNEFVKVTLSGQDFAKTVTLSYAEANMSLDALEAYIEREIADQLGAALSQHVVDAIGTGTNTANVLASSAVGKISFADIAKAFGSLKRVANPVVYVTRSTLYNNLATIENTAGQLIYQPSANAAVPGTLLGAQVKIEDAVADGTILIVDPKRVVCNMVTDIMVETDKDIKAHNYIYSGYARGEAALIDDASAAELSVKTA